MCFLFSALLPFALLLSGCKDTRKGPSERLSWKFPAEAVSKVTLRTARAGHAMVRTGSQATITVSARPVLAGNGYHAPEPAGRETPAHEWPFDVIASRQGRMLVLTSKGETTFPQHRYLLDALEIEVPRGIEVVREHQAPAKGSPPAEGGQE